MQERCCPIMPSRLLIHSDVGTPVVHDVIAALAAYYSLDLLVYIGLSPKESVCIDWTREPLRPLADYLMSHWLKLYGHHMMPTNTIT